MAFLLTFPLVVKDKTAFAILQAGDMELPESLVITMAGWSALRLLIHWRSEMEMLLSGKRDRCCIVSGLAQVDNVAVPSEWWNIYSLGGQARLQYQVLLVNSAEKWLDPSDWWKNISPYNTDSSFTEHRISEWNVSRSELADWCKQCDVLLNAVKAVEND